MDYRRSSQIGETESRVSEERENTSTSQQCEQSEVKWSEVNSFLLAYLQFSILLLLFVLHSEENIIILLYYRYLKM